MAKTLDQFINGSVSPPMKQCTKCGKEKPVAKFSFRKDTNKYRSECKECINKFMKDYYKENKEKRQKINKKKRQKRLYDKNKIEERDYIVCLICNDRFEQITNSHLKTHDFTLKEYKKRFLNYPLNCENIIKKKRITIKTIWADPDSVYNSTEWRELQSEVSKKNWADSTSKFNTPEYREKLSKAFKKMWANPDSKVNTPEFRETKRINAINQKHLNKFTKIEILLLHGLIVRGYYPKVDFFLHENVANICNVDFIFPVQKLAVFVDGCYWHACPIHKPIEIMDPNKTQNKSIIINVTKNKQKTETLEKAGIKVLRFWGHKISEKRYSEANLEGVLDRIEEALKN